MVKVYAPLLFGFLLFFMPLVAHSQSDNSHNATESVVLGGAERSFVVHTPEKLAGGKNLPVVIVLHGGGGDAAGVMRQTGMNAVADKNGFLAVYPEGTPAMLSDHMRTWNAGRCCGAAMRKKIDDVGFISAVIDRLIAAHGADPARIYVTGHSNGAQLTYRLVCELSGRIAAAAPNAGEPLIEDCKPARPVALLHLHGDKDPCALFDGGKKCGGCYGKALGISLPGETWACGSVRDAVKDQAKHNGCEAITDIVFTKGAVTCEAFEKCPKQAPVELCTIAGAGHMWAGVHDRGPAACDDDPDRKICKTYRDAVGPQNADIDASQFMWDFFKDISVPPAVKTP
jgi:polyhydroxybutyrate depolymerase